jgi:hypothetical protein
VTPWSRIDNGKSMYLNRLVRFCVALRFVVTSAIVMFAMTVVKSLSRSPVGGQGSSIFQALTCNS